MTHLITMNIIALVCGWSKFVEGTQQLKEFIERTKERMDKQYE